MLRQSNEQMLDLNHVYNSGEEKKHQNGKFIYHGTFDQDFEKAADEYNIPKVKARGTFGESIERRNSFVIHDGTSYSKEKLLGAGGSGAAYLFTEISSSEYQNRKKLVVKSMTSAYNKTPIFGVTFSEILTELQKEQEVIKWVSKGKYGDSYGITPETQRFTNKFADFRHTEDQINKGDTFHVCSLTMEYVEGVTLDKKIEEIQDPKVLVKLVTKSLQEVVKLRKEANIVHGDPHPGNIMVQDDKITLIDFGLSKIIGKAPDDKDPSLYIQDEKALTHALGIEVTALFSLWGLLSSKIEKTSDFKFLAPFFADIMTLMVDGRIRSIDEVVAKLEILDAKLLKKHQKKDLLQCSSAFFTAIHKSADQKSKKVEELKIPEQTKYGCAIM